MTEKKRGWVKNAAIIFLAVLLALTFFSNTIMNYSLPEVSGGYYGGGTIRSAIRGQGEVVANMSYSVQLSETRQIKSVNIKAGERVEAGQVLFVLEEAESDELKTAIRALEDLNLALTKKLLQMRPADYGSDNRAITRLQEEIAELEAKRQPALDHAQALLDMKQNVKAAQAILDALLEEQAAIDEKLAALSSSDELDYEHLMTDHVRRLRNDLETAKEEVKAATKALAKAEEELAENSGDDSGSISSLLTKISAKSEEIEALVASKPLKRLALLEYIEGVYGDDDFPGDPPVEYEEYILAKSNPDEYEAKANAPLSPTPHFSQPGILAEIAAYQRIDSDINKAQAELSALNTELFYAQSNSTVAAHYKDAVTAAKNRLEIAKENQEAAQAAYDRSLKELSAQYKSELAFKKTEVKGAQSVLDDIKEAQGELESQSITKPEDLDASIKTKQREIEDLLFALSEKQDDDRVTASIEELDLKSDRRAITDQEELVEELRGKTESSDVTSRYTGIITAVNCIAGDKVDAGTDLASLDIEGKGFSVSFAVTTEQSQKLRIGDNSTISRYWGEDLLVTLSAIRNDPQSQGRQKILEFTVEGEVTVGETLNVTIGERDQSYDCVLPNSAIREDADGKFILIAEVKSTPLGSRYTAVRLDVSVLAKDDVNSAIARDIYNNEFVITTATKPVEPGTQVRLVNG